MTEHEKGRLARRDFLRVAGTSAVLPAVPFAWPASTGRAPESFFRVREAMICPTGRSEQFSEFSWTNFETWPDERLRRYPAFLKACGFNSVQLTEIRGYCGNHKTQDLPAVTRVIGILAEEARRSGMGVSQFIWGQCLFHEGQSICWNDSRERGWMQKEFRRLAKAYAPLVDHIVLHYSDPGGCKRNGCDPYRTPQLISEEILAAYRNVNPSVRATISTWANESFFDGQPQVPVLLDETYSSKELGIGLHRWYNPDQARIVRQAGRRLGIWSWYISDYEMATDCAFGMKVIDRHFSSLPRRASSEVDWISMERCWHGMPSDINLWVAGQKMIDPYKSLEQIEREFCTLVFGSKADPVLRAFQVCEEGQVDQRIYGYFIPESERYPALTGSAEFHGLASEAVRELTGIHGPFSAQIPLVTPPEDMVLFLKNRLRLLLSYEQAMKKGDQALERIETDPLYWTLRKKLSEKP